ncbi:tautomerase family protein [Streptomyces sp. ME02-8801-2C]|uniref:tautomerase family protein n=1 Tax=Streptomyces sp. ME02-8801-2C TaxID=3028680 RepID=UPI0029AB9393|nr:tautomerase family protein [Streptomyces sp. ME02-8801-2C]MDX3452055.1 tautomerase family protein [Streptomyces sp. ME02-8801-2C]
MPYWEIFAPENAYTPEDREQLSERITSLYVDYANLPKFYVVILFQDVPENTMYVGGKAATNFVRIRVNHVARQMVDPELRFTCMEVIGEKLAPFVKDRGYDWEIHIDESPMDLWRTQGLVPPPPESDVEKLWAKENRAIPHEVAS